MPCRSVAPDADGIRAARLGRGTVLLGEDLERLLQRANVSRESLVDLGLQVARRRHDAGRYYFIVNGGERDVQGWIPLDDRATARDHLRSHDRPARRCREFGGRARAHWKCSLGSPATVR